jgi:titin
VAIPNDAGVTVSGGSSDDLIGGVVAGAGNLISGNVTGVRVIAAVRTVVQGNFVGTDITGTTALANTFRGVSVSGNSTDVVIGGSTLAATNLVSGNLRGIDLAPLAADIPDGTQILGNLIGTDVTGAAPLPNTNEGIRIDGAEATTVGGLGDERNVVSASSIGISILGAPTVGTTVIGNYIGTDVSGSAALGNSTGIFLPSGAVGHTIGEPGKGNVVAASGGAGISIAIGSSDNSIDSNIIGLDAAGTTALPNQRGVRIEGPTNTVLNNVISGNSDVGIEMVGQGAVGNVINGNSLGETVFGDPAGNQVGVQVILGGDNIISGNRIAHSIWEGVQVRSGGGNRISMNEMFANGLLGIDLFPLGVAINDPMDLDEGPNQLQNYPELTSASYCGTNLAVDGTLHSFPLVNYDVELFLSDACDASGYGEGATPLGTAAVGTDNLGDAAFAFPSFALLPAGSTPGVTATATDDVGNTSEFSACLPVTDGRPGAVCDLAWPNKTELLWSATAGATGYRAYVGTPGQLPDLLTTGIDSLLAWTGVATTTGSFFVSDPPSRQFDWAIVRATSGCGEGSPGLASAGLRIHDSGGTASNCAHDKCDPGPADLPLVATCDPCVNEVCAADPYCCDTDWDSFCVEEVRTVCGNLTCDESAGACAHPLCSTGASLTAGCDTPPLVVSCVDAVCAFDDYCCTTEWDAICVGEVPLLCDANCD